MVVTIAIKPIDKNDLANCVKKFGLPLPTLIAGMGMRLHTSVESVAIKAFQNYLHTHEWAIRLHFLQLLSEDNYEHIHALRVEASVTDYPEMIAKILPLLQQQIRQEPKMQPALEILEIIGEDLQPTLEQAPFLYKENKMTNIAGIIVRENREKLCERLNELLVQKEIPVHITAISVTE